MELRDYILILRKSWLLIVATAVIGIVAGGAISFATAPSYSSHTSVFVSIQSDPAITGSELNSGTTYVQNQVKSFAQVASTDKVLQPVIDELDLNETVSDLAERIEATAPLDTVIIDITARDESPTEAAILVNAVGESLIAAVQDLSQSEKGDSPVKMSTVAPGIAATSADSPNLRLNIALGALIGLALGLGIAVIRQMLDTRVHGSRDIAQITPSALLGSITFDDEAESKPLVIHVSPHGPRAEAFRQLRTNLQFVKVDADERSYIVTSSVPSEGKSSTAVNLAITLAEAGSKVILIDGDLRRPKVADYMGIEGAVGLTDHLIGHAELDDVVQPWGSGNLHVLPAGQIPPNPSELLGSKAMIALLERLSADYDIVLIDAPPLLPVTDAAVLSKIVSGGALLVVGSGKIRRHQLEAAIASLETVGGRLVGMILNFVPTKGPDSRGYYGYYGNEHVAHPAATPRKTSRKARVVKTKV